MSAARFLQEQCLPAEPDARAAAPWRDPAAEPLIRVEGLTKRFGDVVALDDVSLQIFEREFFCLLGPSGCGKTTLMRAIAGFETPERGRIVLGGGDLAGVPPHRRPINMMFQSYALFPHMSVAGNIAYGLKQDRLPRGEIEARVAEMLRLVQLDGLGARRPDRLSGGQRQRVALARALAKRPKVLLLDEPLAALDKKLRQETQFELMELQARLGITFVVVTHDQGEAMTMASRIAVMDRGRVAQVGTPAEIYDTPRSRFVAEFVGDVNVFSGRAEAPDGGRWRIRTPSCPTPLLVEASGLDRGAEVAVAVRPERISFIEGAPAERHNVLEGEVVDAAYLGDRTVWRVRLARGETVRVTEPGSERARHAERGRNARVHLSFSPDAAMVLPP